MKRLRIFGDSIMKGVVYRGQDKRYVKVDSYDVARLGSSLGYDVYNSSIFGCTVTKGLQQLQRAIQNGLACDYALVEYGGNDCDFLWDEIASNPFIDHQPKTPLPVFDTTLRSMVELLKQNGITPILMNLPPIDSSRYLNHICRNGLDKNRILEWLYDENNIERHQELYSLRISKVSVETNTNLIDIRSGFLARKDCAHLICEDGIHPSETGYALIAQLLSEYHSAKATA
jgi:lysophospholipase L1-like esterase